MKKRKTACLTYLFIRIGDIHQCSVLQKSHCLVHELLYVGVESLP